MSIILQCESLTKSFGGVFAVNGVDLQVQEGTIHTVIGPNGAGKSTFFNLISGEIVPTNGTVHFKGKDITGDAPYKMPHYGMARCFQRTNVFPELSVFENVWAALFARMNHSPLGFLKSKKDFPEIDMEALNIISDVGLSHKPDDAAQTLSHGQSRMLEVAVTIAGRPDLMLLDEPTQGLAPEATVEMTSLIKRLAKNFTIVLIEHKMQLVMEISDIISVLNLGQIIAEGSPEEIKNDDRVLDAYLGRAAA